MEGERETREPVAPVPAPTPDRAPTAPVSEVGGAGVVQRRAIVGASDDPAEREADEIADMVVAASASTLPVIAREADAATRRVRRAPTPREARSERVTPQRRVQRSATATPIGSAGGIVDKDTDAAITAARSGGRQLERGIRRRMERSIGADFSGVRLHVGAESDRLNDQLQAKAFTTGRDVFVRRSEYAPNTKQGQHLLAHELAHTVQQGAAPPLSGDHDVDTAAPVRRAVRAASDGVTRRTLIQRAPGLPTKKEAETDGGKAGFHFGRGKTTWGQLLTALHAYENLADDDIIGQKAKVVEVQTLITEWLNGGARGNEDGSKSDQKKRAYLGQVMAQTRKRYYELELKGDTVDAAGANAGQHAGANAQKIKAALLAKGLENSDATITRLLARLRAADLTTNFEPVKFPMFAKDPYFKNFFEIKASGFGGDKSPGGDLNPQWGKLTGSEQRETAERWLGYKPFTEVQRVNRPNYAAVNVFNKAKGAASTYGRCHFIWKDEVKNRCTYTARDTFAMNADADLKDIDPAALIGTPEHLETVLAHNEKVLETMALLDEDRAAEAAVLEANIGVYMEAQVHGGLSLLDVKEMVVPWAKNSSGPDDFDNASRDQGDALAAKYGFAIRYGV